MNSVSIRKVELDDLFILQKVSVETFCETFASVNNEENMSEYLESSLSIDKLTEELQDKNTTFYFAFIDNKVIAYLKINFGESQTELQDHEAIEIERIYVLKEFQGRSIGQLLFDRVVLIAKQSLKKYIWLGVWEENPKAIRFYKKNGFIVFDKHIFKLGNDEQTDLLMKCIIE